MGIDGKYGRVSTERGSIGEDEPVIVFRAQDATTPDLIEAYRDLCIQAGSPQHHIDLINATLWRFVRWQQDHPTKVPSSDGYVPQV